MDERLQALLDAARSDRPAPGAATTGWETLQATMAAGRAPVVDPSVADASPLAPLLTPATGVTASAVAKIALAATVAGGMAVATIATIDAVGEDAPAIDVVNTGLGGQMPSMRPRRTPPRAEIHRIERPGLDPTTTADVEPPASAEETPRRGAQRPPEDLDDSMELLQRAWAAIKAGRHQEALRLTSKHRHMYPDSVLDQERSASRLVALCRLGRLDAARRSLSRFLARHPNSVHLARLRRDCAAVFTRE